MDSLLSSEIQCNITIYRRVFIRVVKTLTSFRLKSRPLGLNYVKAARWPVKKVGVGGGAPACQFGTCAR